MILNNKIPKEPKNPVDVIGQKVYLQHEDEIEYGVIVNAWVDSYLKATDCLIAFYPQGLNYGEDPYEFDKPYILRYLYQSLRVIEDEK